MSDRGLPALCLQVISGFGTVFVDQAYWQSAIAARPSASVRGYLLGGMLWFSIPFTLATSLGACCMRCAASRKPSPVLVFPFSLQRLEG